MDYILTFTGTWKGIEGYEFICPCGEVVYNSTLLSHIETSKHKEFIASHQVACSCGKMIRENDRMAHMAMEHIVYSYIGKCKDRYMFKYLANKSKETNKPHFRCACGKIVTDTNMLSHFEYQKGSFDSFYHEHNKYMSINHPPEPTEFELKLRYYMASMGI